MKLLKIFLISILTFILLGSSAFASTGKVTGNKVRIREKADSSSKEISIATQGETVEVIGEEGDWYKVNFEKYTGYMSKEYIDTDFSDGASTTNEPVTTPEPTPEPDDNTSTENPSTLEPENTPQVDNTVETQEPTSPVEEQPTTPEEPSTTETIPDSNKEYQIGESVTFSEETSLKYLPNFTSREIFKAEKDSTYNIISVLNKWVKVSNDTNSGWILCSNINGSSGEETDLPETQNPETPEEQPTQPSESTRKGTVNVESAKVRVEPDGESLGSIKEGTEVTILGEEDDWLHIKTEEYNDCYIAKRLITEK